MNGQEGISVSQYHQFIESCNDDGIKNTFIAFDVFQSLAEEDDKVVHFRMFLPLIIELLIETGSNKQVRISVIKMVKVWNKFIDPDENGNVLLKGNKVLVGGNDIYKTVCRKHFRKLTNLI